MGAVDPINALFNYGYSLLASQCWKALNANGLDPNVGVLHEQNPSKAPLVYDLQEPFRWLVDVAVISALERNIFDKKDFVRTENYNIRLRPDGVRKLMTELITQFTHRVRYGKLNLEWRNVIVEKAYELGYFLSGKRKNIAFTTPSPELNRDDSDVLRNRILTMSYAQWKSMGMPKSNLHYLKAKAKDDKPFSLYVKVREKLTVENE
jgi:CRISPR-associated protein Cas1